MEQRAPAWQRLTESNAREAFEAAAARSIGELAGDGQRGIVIPGGGRRYLPGAYVAAALLRRLGCALPIELWHMGHAEMPDGLREPLQRLGVEIVDAFDVRREHPVRCLGGYELKAFALVHTRFTEVLLLDADNVPVVDPSFLFETPEFAARGAIFWPDYGMSRPALATGALSRTHPIWALTGVAFRGEREFESGQICVDRRRCLRELVLALWLNEHSDFWYRYLWGDKDTFHLAFRKLGREWAMPARGPIDLSGLAMAQCDFEGRIIFQHRHGAKWSLDDNPRIPGFKHEALCLELLAAMGSSWLAPDGSAR
jgi:hypothetical protein